MQISQLETNSNIRPSVETSMFENHLVAPTKTYSCPVTPARSKNAAKLDTPSQRKPYRTVSFGPMNFEERSIGSVLSDQLSVEVEMSVQDHERNVDTNEVFYSHLDLPGTIHTHPERRKRATSTDQTSARNSYSKNLTVGRLRRTVSSGSAAISSITAQVIFYFDFWYFRQHKQKDYTFFFL